MIKKYLSHSFFRYLVVGITSLGIDYGLLLLLYRLVDWPLPLATSIAFFAGLLTNFLLNKYWSFEAPRGARHSSRQVFLYVALVSFNLIFTNAFIIALVAVHIGPEISKPFTTAIITTWNYLLYRRFIFKGVPSEPD